MTEIFKYFIIIIKRLKLCLKDSKLNIYNKVMYRHLQL